MKNFVVCFIVLAFCFFIASCQPGPVINTSEETTIARYKRENENLRVIAERLELQYKINTYRQKMNIRVAKPVPKEKLGKK